MLPPTLTYEFAPCTSESFSPKGWVRELQVWDTSRQIFWKNVGAALGLGKMYKNESSVKKLRRQEPGEESEKTGPVSLTFFFFLMKALAMQQDLRNCRAFSE